MFKLTYFSKLFLVSENDEDHDGDWVLPHRHILSSARSESAPKITKVSWNYVVACPAEGCESVRPAGKLTRALRTVLKVDYRYSRHDLYQRLHIDCLNAKVKKDLVILIYKILHNILPDFLSGQLILKISNYNIRNSAIKVQLPKPNTNFCIKNSTIYMYIATQLFNELPEPIRTETILSHFKKAIDSVFLLELWVLLYVPLFILFHF